MTCNGATLSSKVRGVAHADPAAHQSTESVLRIHYFDWLRAIAVLVVIIYHTFLPFAGKWLISNTETSDRLHEVALLFETFALAILFLIAGAGARFALQRHCGA